MRSLLALALALLVALLSSPALAERQNATPVVVRFERFVWVYAAGGNPYIEAGRALVPLRETCDLLGATCAELPDGRASVSLNGRSTAVARTGKFVALSRVAGPLGLSVRWDAANRMAFVERVRKAQGGLTELEDFLLEHPSPGSEIGSPLFARMNIEKDGRSLTVIPAQGTLLTMSLYSRTADGGRGVSGYATPSSPDIPNRQQECSTDPPSACTAPYGRNDLYRLAVLSWTP